MTIELVILIACCALLIGTAAWSIRMVLRKLRKRRSHLSLLKRYNVILSKYGIDSKQSIKFCNTHAKNDLFIRKAELMRKAERIKTNVMFSRVVEKKIKRNSKNG